MVLPTGFLGLKWFVQRGTVRQNGCQSINTPYTYRYLNRTYKYFMYSVLYVLKSSYSVPLHSNLQSNIGHINGNEERSKSNVGHVLTVCTEYVME